MQTKTAAAYARYSTDNQTHSSIEYQMRKIEEYCKAHELTITARFEDAAYSGTNTNRPAFQQLCAAASTIQTGRSLCRAFHNSIRNSRADKILYHN